MVLISFKWTSWKNLILIKVYGFHNIIIFISEDIIHIIIYYYVQIKYIFRPSAMSRKIKIKK